MKKTNNKGFSLVELIIVIAIMAVLIGVLAPQFIKYVESSRQSTDIQNLQEIKTAIETYVAEQGEKVSGNVTITIDATGATVSDNAAAAVTAVGLENPTKWKSKGWTGKTYTYNTSTFTWNKDNLQNSKEPKKDLGTVFGATEAAASSSASS